MNRLFVAEHKYFCKNFRAMTIKQQLVLELENSSPEVVAQVFEFVQFLKKGKQKKTQKKVKKEHFLAGLAGSISPEDGEELAAIVNREFQTIEGEW